MSTRLRLALYGLLGMAALVLGAKALPDARAALLIKYGGGWLIAAWVAAWVATTWWVLRPDRLRPADGRAWGRTAWAPALAVAVAGVFLLTREPYGFKVTMDELALGTTSMSLHFERVAAATVRGYELQGYYRDLGNFLDKRPLLFPWLASLLHDVSGYRMQNLFVLNSALTFALLGLVFRAGVWLRDRRTGYLALALVTGLPLLAQNATGAGFDLLNSVMLLVTLLTAARYLREPRPATQAWFLLTVILLANSRYESVLFVVSAGAVLVGEWILRRRVMMSWALWLAPLAFVPLLWHLRVFKLAADFWQLPAGVTSPFGLGFFYDNVGHFMVYLADPRSSSSPVLAVGAVFGFGFSVLYFARYWVRRVAEQPERLAWWALLAGMAVNLGVLLCYHWGQVDQYEVSRLLLPFFVLGALAAAWAWGEITSRRAAWWGAFAAVGLSLYVFSLPVMARAVHTRSNYFAERMAWTLDFHRRLPPGNYFYLTQGPLIFTLNQVSALNISQAAEVAPRLKYHLDHGTFEEAFVVQNILIHPETGQEHPSPENECGPAYQLETVAQKAFRPFVVTRISRVVGIDPAARCEPAEPPAAGTATLAPDAPGREMTYDDAEFSKRWLESLP